MNERRNVGVRQCWSHMFCKLSGLHARYVRQQFVLYSIKRKFHKGWRGGIKLFQLILVHMGVG